MDFETADSNAEASAELNDISSVMEEHNSNNDPGKMFIGGLSWQTTADALKQYFGKFGEISECMIVKDPATKRGRGFGFITFAQPSSVDKVLEEAVHELDGKKIDPKVAFPKRTQPKMVTKTKKVFIGGLSANSSVEDMKTYFSQFGKIEEAMLMFDKSTNRHRGFGFICFDSEDVVDKICEIHFHEINGKMVECKKAQPKEVMLPTQLEKSRAALASRSLYGIPEPLLASYAAAAACLPRMGYNPGTVLYQANPNYFGLMLTPGEKFYPEMAALSSPPALAIGARPDWGRSLLAAGYTTTPTAAGFISSPTSPNCPAPFSAPGHRTSSGSFSGTSPPSSMDLFHHHHSMNAGGHQFHHPSAINMMTGPHTTADLSALLAAAAANQHAAASLPQFQLKATQLIASYNNNYH